MKQLFLTALVVLGVMGCASNQAVPQQPEPDPKSRIADNTALKPEGCVTVEVDYDLKPTAMAKGYDWTLPYIKDGNFQAKPRGTGKVVKEVCWFKFANRTSWTSFGDAQSKIEAGGQFLVADLWELNSLGTAKPGLQRKFPLIGLGSRWRDPGGYLFCPVLSEDGHGRDLSLRGVDYWSRGHYRFPAVRIRK